MVKVAASILSADFSKLGEEISSVEKDVDMFHLDVMDGSFVPNITIGMPVIKDLRKHTKKPFDVHLMILNPGRYIEDFAKAGAESITFHLEAVQNPKIVINKIKKSGCKAAIALNPETSVDRLKDILQSVDMVLIMSVHPGFGGQSFISKVLPKVEWLVKKRAENNYHYKIQIDGGINDETAHKAVEAGVEILVAGSYIYHSRDRKEAIEKLKKIK